MKLAIMSPWVARIGWLVLFSWTANANASCGSDQTARFNWNTTKYLITFGDSYTYVQGTNGYPGYSFIGNSLSPKDLAYTPQELLTTRINQSFYGTSAGGPVWTNYLTGCAVQPGLWLPSQCHPTQLWDFAFAGADYSSAFLPQHHNFSTQLLNQTRQYLTYGEPVIGKHMDKSAALVAIWIGINDVSDAAQVIANKTDTGAFARLYSSIVSALFAESVHSLHEAGYPNFLFINVPPEDRAPGRKAGAVPTSGMIASWNAALAAHNANFAASNRGVKSMLYDSNAFLGRVLDNYGDYGFKNITGFCPAYLNAASLSDPGLFGCAPLDTYFWFNTGHITSRTHQILAEDMKRFLLSQSHS